MELLLPRWHALSCTDRQRTEGTKSPRQEPPENVRNSWVNFRICDAYVPEPVQILTELHGNDQLRGKVIDGILEQQVSATAPRVTATGWALQGSVYDSKNNPAPNLTVFLVNAQNLPAEIRLFVHGRQRSISHQLPWHR
jgi:hypothetical protein